jgi:uncharacterized phage infection (PIP) family protein YhgE
MQRPHLSNEVTLLDFTTETDMAAARLFLESLGPNNELHNAISELQLLLQAETAIILSQVNRRTSDMYKELRESSATTKEINERTIEIHDNLSKEKQKDNETYAAIERSQRQLSAAMDRVEAASGASHASIEEVKELILSAWQGSPLVIE